MRHKHYLTDAQRAQVVRDLEMLRGVYGTYSQISRALNRSDNFVSALRHRDGSTNRQVFEQICNLRRAVLEGRREAPKPEPRPEGEAPAPNLTPWTSRVVIHLMAAAEIVGAEAERQPTIVRSRLREEQKRLEELAELYTD